MLRPNSNDRTTLLQRGEAGLPPLRFSPRNLLFHVVEERYNVTETVLHVDVAVGDRDEEDFELGGEGGAGEEHGEDVVDALIHYLVKQASN